MNSGLFSIYIQKANLGSRLPPAVENHIASFKEHCSNLGQNHYLLGDEEIREIIRNHHGEDLLRCYERLRPEAFKADLARYAVLHRFGGVYADLSMIFLNPAPSLSNSEQGLLCHGIKKPNIYNGFLAARAGDQLLEKALDLIIERVHLNFYGANPVSITGPRLLADALATQDGSLYRFYTVKALTPDQPTINMAVLDDEGRILCLRNKRKVGGIEELGLPSSDYRTLWSERQVYQ